MQQRATSSAESTPSPDATPEPSAPSPSPTQSGLLTTMLVATAWGHSTDTRMPW